MQISPDLAQLLRPSTNHSYVLPPGVFAISAIGPARVNSAARRAAAQP
jgi:hypothetical protein